jgi:hypothetical protein
LDLHSMNHRHQPVATIMRQRQIGCKKPQSIGNGVFL